MKKQCIECREMYLADRFPSDPDRCYTCRTVPKQLRVSFRATTFSVPIIPVCTVNKPNSSVAAVRIVASGDRS